MLLEAETNKYCPSGNDIGAISNLITWVLNYFFECMAKAFETLSHSYLEQVLKFFKMGPKIRKWLRMLGTNRTACIILDDNSYSRSFKLGRGAAQENNISPDTFDFCDQILIFKIELDPNIA
jgi:hypothetical protein